MSFYITITRKPNPHWRSGEAIALDEWKNIIASDSELHSPALADIADSNGYGKSEDAIWQRHPEDKNIWFIWDDGQIDVNHPDRYTLKKMADIAGKLRANMISETGEIFDSEGTSLGLSDLQPDPADVKSPSLMQQFESYIIKVILLIGICAIFGLAYLLFQLIRHEWF